MLLTDTYSNCLEPLRSGQAVAVSTDNVILAGLVDQNPGEFKIVGDPFTEEPYGIGLKKGDDDFRTFINDVLEESYEDGTYEEAWDATGESFAQRMAQYVRFYSGDPIRLTAGFYAQYDKAPLFELVERALGRRDGVPLPITPDDPSAPVPYRPDTKGMAGTYASTSLPTARP